MNKCLFPDSGCPLDLTKEIRTIEPMIDFTYDVLPGRVLFGAGSRDRVSAEIERLTCSRALVLSTPGYSDKAKDLAQKMGHLAAGIFSRAVMHTPVSVSEEAVHAAGAVNADCL